ncbi:ECF transporter S component [Carnobacterium mobile]|uniref:ECF transporter S component n=1 Tax=Carnobacterium mobile TaxID=2750 RepID=UPI00186847AE|nr:ECF transporter S component [Carnobacterium mobile]
MACKAKQLSIQRLTLLAMMTTLCQVSRLVFQFLPNVQPVTVILIILTLSLGVSDGLIVAVLSIFISNLTLGMGVWTIAQIISFVLLVLVTGVVIKPFFKHLPFLIMVLYAVLMGYLYGFIISLVQAPFFGIQNFWIYYISGLPFDTLHAIGNGGFYLILAPILFPLLKKFSEKYFKE